VVIKGATVKATGLYRMDLGLHSIWAVSIPRRRGTTIVNPPLDRDIMAVWGNRNGRRNHRDQWVAFATKMMW
jgi:hypothetical protein